MHLLPCGRNDVNVLFPIIVRFIFALTTIGNNIGSFIHEAISLREVDGETTEFVGLHFIQAYIVDVHGETDVSIDSDNWRKVGCCA